MRARAAQAISANRSRSGVLRPASRSPARRGTPSASRVGTGAAPTPRRSLLRGQVTTCAPRGLATSNDRAADEGARSGPPAVRSREHAHPVQMLDRGVSPGRPSTSSSHMPRSLETASRKAALKPSSQQARSPRRSPRRESTAVRRWPRSGRPVHATAVRRGRVRSVRVWARCASRRRRSSGSRSPRRSPPAARSASATRLLGGVGAETEDLVEQTTPRIDDRRNSAYQRSHPRAICDVPDRHRATRDRMNSIARSAAARDEFRLVLVLPPPRSAPRTQFR